jgi:hypothetical protein
MDTPAIAKLKVYLEPSLPPPSVAVTIRPRKEECNCACGVKDELGRYPIGWCGPDCERRPR